MAKERVVIHLDSRLVALLGDDRSGNIRDAIIQLYNVDRTSLTPNVTEYAGGAKPLPTSEQYPGVRTSPQSGKPPKQAVAQVKTHHRVDPVPSEPFDLDCDFHPDGRQNPVVKPTLDIKPVSETEWQELYDYYFHTMVHEDVLDYLNERFVLDPTL